MFLAIIAPGANLFIIIVALLIAAGTGLTATDYLKAKARQKKWEEQENVSDNRSEDTAQE